jgi:hypothetical protein
MANVMTGIRLPKERHGAERRDAREPIFSAVVIVDSDIATPSTLGLYCAGLCS